MISYTLDSHNTRRIIRVEVTPRGAVYARSVATAVSEHQARTILALLNNNEVERTEEPDSD